MRNPEFITVKDGASVGRGVESICGPREALLHARNACGASGQEVRVYRLIAVISPPQNLPRIDLLEGHGLIPSDIPVNGNRV